MKLTVVIVNYNVKYFLEQCLHSVYKALHQIEAEVFVVDNNSVDGSCAMVRQKFPQAILIENKENLGFSKANNQAIRLSKGQYVLLLNPDTVVEEDTFTKVIDFMDTHPKAGGLGVKMIDGKGIFLPESKRGLPTPMVAFYKIFGLSRLFPRSKTFARYHLGYMSNHEIHEIEVLAGAFMLMRKETLDKVGLLDEDYFMYGEDIDLSYRITLGGYKNYYFPETTIIHYKGESTKKGSINYVKVFYNAMIIFARKHFSTKNAQLFSFFINLAIYFRAVLAIFSRVVKAILLPLLDFLALFAGFLVIAPQWENIKFPEGGHFPIEYFTIAVPAYIFLWMLTIYLSGGYDKPVQVSKFSRGLVVGTGIILIVYALLPENLRFSRAMILMGTFWGFLSMLGIRFIFHFGKITDFRLDLGQRNRMALVGEAREAERVLTIIKQSVPQFDYLGLIAPNEQTSNDNYIGNISQLPEIVQVNRINELIFCASNIPAQQIIREMLRLEGSGVSYKIAPPESVSIIGSNSIDTAGDLYTVDFNNLTKPHNLRKKRIFDIAASLFLLVLLPVYLVLVTNRGRWIRNLFSVLFGIKSWVGFYYRSDVNTLNLPHIKKGILSWALVHSGAHSDATKIENLNLLYAKDYRLTNDLWVLLKGFRYIGKT
ncbi:MAG: glycosyltransferase family 2 protein [Salinivirgaceae bacterium]|nr:glycosyltransferase family 2 protein [Salinivirgaceae bacterium]